MDDWERRLMLFARTIEEWFKCQRNWLYLEPVFSAADIQRQLPSEADMFTQVGHTFRLFVRCGIIKHMLMHVDEMCNLELRIMDVFG